MIFNSLINCCFYTLKLTHLTPNLLLYQIIYLLTTKQFINLSNRMQIPNSIITTLMPHNSETLSKGISRTFTLHQNQNSEPQSKVLIYLRQTNKRAHKIQVPSVMEAGELFEYVHTFCKIDLLEQILFYKGKRIDPHKPHLMIRLMNAGIVHVGKKDCLCIYDEQLVVNFECYHQGTKINSTKIITNSNQKMFMALRSLKVIGEDFQINDNSVQVYQYGRKINTSNSFYEQQVQRKSCLIVIVHVLHSVYSTSPTQQAQIQDEQENDIPVINIRYEGTPENQDYQARKEMLEVKSIECNDEDEYLPPPNFKKQNKTSHLYKSTRSPIDKEVQKWESDSSSEFVKKERLKAILIKKDSHNKDRHFDFDEQQNERVMRLSNSSENSESFGKFSILEKMQLKSDFRKLFQSERVLKESDSKKLQPPKMMSEEFLDQIEEIQIDDGDFSQPFYGSTSHDNHKMNMIKPHLGCGLQKSLGTPGKREWPVAMMIPTHDIDIQQDDDESDDQDDEDF